ncbi:MAG: hypothetical protein ABSF71_28285 [Terriglobia bacterium]|jgi:hypothetical protein
MFQMLNEESTQPPDRKTTILRRYALTVAGQVSSVYQGGPYAQG